jgi:hypothetical protein
MGDDLFLAEKGKLASAIFESQSVHFAANNSRALASN